MGRFCILVCFTVVLAFGFVHGSAAQDLVRAYDLNNGNLSIKVTNFGARIMNIVLPDKYGKLGDIVLGFDTAEEYTKVKSNFGALIGRVVSRIADAEFTLNGTTYKLTPNSGNNSIHGGPKGFGNVIWNVTKYQPKCNAPYIELTYYSVDGDEGFPGNLEVSVVYELLAGNQLSVVAKAKALNKPTPVNLGLHAFWNLGNHNSGAILSEELQIFASKHIVIDSQKLPTGEIAPVKGTPYDYLTPATIESKIDGVPGGYDMNFVLDDTTSTRLKKAAILHDKKSGRVMEVFTNQPTLHLYTTNTLNTTGKGGFLYKNYAAMNLESQGYPDAVHHPNFPSIIVNPGETYKHLMLFKFSTS